MGLQATVPECYKRIKEGEEESGVEEGEVGGARAGPGLLQMPVPKQTLKNNKDVGKVHRGAICGETKRVACPSVQNPTTDKQGIQQWNRRKTTSPILREKDKCQHMGKNKGGQGGWKEGEGAPKTENDMYIVLFHLERKKMATFCETERVNTSKV